MASPEQALATQLQNIQAKTGKSLQDLYTMVAGSGMAKVSQQRQWLMQTTGLGYGDANTIVLLAKKALEAPAAAATQADDALAAIYSGNKAGLRELHDRVMAGISGFGAFEAAPKKGYVSLRRKKQFAMIGPATQSALEIGLNAKTLLRHPRLKVMPAASMCRATTRIDAAAQIDAALLGWLKTSYDEAG